MKVLKRGKWEIIKPGKWELIFILWFFVFFGLTYSSGLFIKIEEQNRFYNLYQMLCLLLIFLQSFYLLKPFFIFKKANWKFIGKRSALITLGITLLLIGETFNK